MKQQLPSYFEYAAEHERVSNLWPVTYELEREGFVVGGVFIPTTKFSPYEFNVFEHEIEDESVPYDVIAEHPLMVPHFGGPVAGPKLHEWVAANRDRVKNEIPEIMHHVYTQFYEDPNAVLFSLDSGHRGFAARTKEDGGLNLQVLGDCACMGVSLYSGIADGMEHGFAQYELHNTDTTAQTVSLYAGIGHIARLASGRELNQMKLF